MSAPEKELLVQIANIVLDYNRSDENERDILKKLKLVKSFIESIDKKYIDLYVNRYLFTLKKYLVA
jgi:hypothetical protein